MRTVGNKLLVVVKKKKEQKHGSIFLPSSAADASATKTGKVMAAGPEAKVVKVDDLVLFESLMGVEIDADDDYQTICLSEDNILAVV